MTALKEKQAVVLGIEVRIVGSDSAGFYYSINGSNPSGPFPSALAAAEAAEKVNELLRGRLCIRMGLKHPHRSVRQAAALTVRIFDAEPGETHTCDICGAGIRKRIHVLPDGRTVGQDCVKSIGRAALRGRS
jgi:hypothetical protein